MHGNVEIIVLFAIVALNFTKCMSIILSCYQHCDEQQFQTLPCALYTIFPVLMQNLAIQALLLDYILALEKNTRTPCVHLVFIEKSIF